MVSFGNTSIEPTVGISHEVRYRAPPSGSTSLASGAKSIVSSSFIVRRSSLAIGARLVTVMVTVAWAVSPSASVIS